MNRPWRRREGGVRVKVVIGHIIFHGSPARETTGAPSSPPQVGDEGEKQRPRRARTPWIYAGLKILIIVIAYSIVSLKNWDSLPGDPSGCDFQEQTHTNIMDQVYGPLMQWRAYTPIHSKVVEVTIEPPYEPLEVTTNTCKGRSFMAGIIHQLALHHPKVIAIDKVYGSDSCTDPHANDALTNAFKEASTSADDRVHTVIVVGQATHPRKTATTSDTDCLVLTPAYDFNQKAHAQGANKILSGLTRLNQNTFKIPLGWWTFPSDKAVETSDDTENQVRVGTKTFSYQAAEQAGLENRNGRDLMEMLESYEHPFARFPERTLQAVGAMELVCPQEKAFLQKHDVKIDCPPAKRTGFDLSLLSGRTVVIGERVDSDKRFLPDREIYGVDLQADYIEALLDGRYAKQLDWLDFSLIILFVLGTCVIAVLERVKHLSSWKALLWSTILFAVLAGVSVGALEISATSYFTPRFFLASSGIVLLLLTQFFLLLLHSQLEETAGRPSERSTG